MADQAYDVLGRSTSIFNRRRSLSTDAAAIAITIAITLVLRCTITTTAIRIAAHPRQIYFYERVIADPTAPRVGKNGSTTTTIAIVVVIIEEIDMMFIQFFLDGLRSGCEWQDANGSGG